MFNFNYRIWYFDLTNYLYLLKGINQSIQQSAQNTQLDNQISEIPFFRLCKIIASNGGLSGKGIVHLAPWVIKTTLFEPLRWIESVRWTKKINLYEITQPPIFILGYYRSGTTYLQRMFMQDPSFGYTSIFQTVLPEIMLSFEKSFTPLLQMVSRTFRLKNHFHRIPLTWKNFPGEEDVALTAMLQPGASQWGSLFPRSFNEYLEKYVLIRDVSPVTFENWKKNYLFLLSKISIANNDKQLVLKNPPNTARIKMLLSLFPRAKFIHIIRDPFEVFSSNRRFWEVLKKNYMLGPAEFINTDALILDSYAAIMQQYQEQKKYIPAGQLAEISYENFIDQPIQTLSDLYTKLDLGNFEICKPAMTDLVQQQKKYDRLQHKLDEGSKDLILQKWDPYIKLWKGLCNDPLYSRSNTR